jgi:hypothetical protein
MKKILCSLLMFTLVSAALAYVENPLLLIGEFPTGPVKSLCSVTAVQSDGQVAVSFAFNIGMADISVKDAQENVVYHEVVDTMLVPQVVLNNTSWPSGNYVLIITWGKNKQITGEFIL